MKRTRRNFGSAMSEMVLSLPLILLILALLLFFGLNMQRLQRVAVADRYEAWREIVDAPGPANNAQLNSVFFGGNAQTLDMQGNNRGHLTDPQDLLVTDAQSYSDQAAAWMATMFDSMPGTRQVRVSATYAPPVAALSRFTGPIQHHHIVLDGDWRYAPWAEWRGAADPMLPVIDHDFWSALRNQYIETLEDRLEPLATSGNDLATALRRCYLHAEPYRGPGDANDWP